MYSLKIHLMSGLVSYLLIWGYDFRDYQVKEVPYLVHQSVMHYGKKRLFLAFVAVMLLGPLAIPFSAILRWWQVRR